MQIDKISISLKELAANAPMAAALGAAGLASNDIHYGATASRDALRPFAMFSVTEVGSEGNSSGVRLKTYDVDLTVVVDERDEVAAAILRAFHAYWDRITELSELEGDDEFVQIVPGASEVGEADETEFGRDVILGTTSWTLEISEHQPELGD